MRRLGAGDFFKCRTPGVAESFQGGVGDLDSGCFPDLTAESTGPEALLRLRQSGALLGVGFVSASALPGFTFTAWGFLRITSTASSLFAIPRFSCALARPAEAEVLPS